MTGRDALDVYLAWEGADEREKPRLQEALRRGREGLESLDPVLSLVSKMMEPGSDGPGAEYDVWVPSPGWAVDRALEGGAWNGAKLLASLGGGHLGVERLVHLGFPEWLGCEIASCWGLRYACRFLGGMGHSTKPPSWDIWLLLKVMERQKLLVSTVTLDQPACDVPTALVEDPQSLEALPQRSRRLDQLVAALQGVGMKGLVKRELKEMSRAQKAPDLVRLHVNTGQRATDAELLKLFDTLLSALAFSSAEALQHGWRPQEWQSEDLSVMLSLAPTPAGERLLLHDSCPLQQGMGLLVECSLPPAGGERDPVCTGDFRIPGLWLLQKGQHVGSEVPDSLPAKLEPIARAIKAHLMEKEQAALRAEIVLPTTGDNPHAVRPMPPRAPPQYALYTMFVDGTPARGSQGQLLRRSQALSQELRALLPRGGDGTGRACYTAQDEHLQPVNAANPYQAFSQDSSSGPMSLGQRAIYAYMLMCEFWYFAAERDGRHPSLSRRFVLLSNEDPERVDQQMWALAVMPEDGRFGLQCGDPLPPGMGPGHCWFKEVQSQQQAEELWAVLEGLCAPDCGGENNSAGLVGARLQRGPEGRLKVLVLGTPDWEPHAQRLGMVLETNGKECAQYSLRLVRPGEFVEDLASRLVQDAAHRRRERGGASVEWSETWKPLRCGRPWRPGGTSTLWWFGEGGLPKAVEEALVTLGSLLAVAPLLEMDSPSHNPDIQCDGLRKLGHLYLHTDENGIKFYGVCLTDTLLNTFPLAPAWPEDDAKEDCWPYATKQPRPFDVGSRRFFAPHKVWPHMNCSQLPKCAFATGPEAGVLLLATNLLNPWEPVLSMAKLERSAGPFGTGCIRNQASIVKLAFGCITDPNGCASVTKVNFGGFWPEWAAPEEIPGVTKLTAMVKSVKLMLQQRSGVTVRAALATGALCHHSCLATGNDVYPVARAPYSLVFSRPAYFKDASSTKAQPEGPKGERSKICYNEILLPLTNDMHALSFGLSARAHPLPPRPLGRAPSQLAPLLACGPPLATSLHDVQRLLQAAIGLWWRLLVPADAWQALSATHWACAMWRAAGQHRGWLVLEAIELGDEADWEAADWRPARRAAAAASMARAAEQYASNPWVMVFLLRNCLKPPPQRQWEKNNPFLHERYEAARRRDGLLVALLQAVRGGGLPEPAVTRDRGLQGAVWQRLVMQLEPPPDAQGPTSFWEAYRTWRDGHNVALAQAALRACMDTDPSEPLRHKLELALRFTTPLLGDPSAVPPLGAWHTSPGLASMVLNALYEEVCKHGAMPRQAPEALNLNMRVVDLPTEDSPDPRLTPFMCIVPPQLQCVCDQVAPPHGLDEPTTRCLTATARAMCCLRGCCAAAILADPLEVRPTRQAFALDRRALAWTNDVQPLQAAEREASVLTLEDLFGLLSQVAQPLQPPAQAVGPMDEANRGSKLRAENNLIKFLNLHTNLLSLIKETKTANDMNTPILCSSQGHHLHTRKYLPPDWESYWTNCWMAEYWGCDPFAVHQLALDSQIHQLNSHTLTEPVTKWRSQVHYINFGPGKSQYCVVQGFQPTPFPEFVVLILEQRTTNKRKER